MGQPGRPKRELVLSDEERETLERWARRHSSSQALALRCRIVLACAEGGSNTEIARRLGLYDDTVGKWRNRFIERRLDGLHDEPRPGKPRTITDDDNPTARPTKPSHTGSRRPRPAQVSACSAALTGENGTAWDIEGQREMDID